MQTDEGRGEGLAPQPGGKMGEGITEQRARKRDRQKCHQAGSPVRDRSAMAASPARNASIIQSKL